jgi:hypothetical protein
MTVEHTGLAVRDDLKHSSSRRTRVERCAQHPIDMQQVCAAYDEECFLLAYSTQR